MTLERTSVVNIEHLMTDTFSKAKDSDMISVSVGDLDGKAKGCMFIVFMCTTDDVHSQPIQPIQTSNPSVKDILNTVSKCLMKSEVKIFGVDIFDRKGRDVDPANLPKNVIFDIYIKDPGEGE